MKIRGAFQSVAAVVGVSLVMGLVGCAPEVRAPTNRPALNANEVELLNRVPRQFENHGLVLSAEIDAVPDGWKADAIVEQLKAAAGAKGANAILIRPIDGSREFSTTDMRYVYVGGFYQGNFYNFPVTRDRPRKMGAIAIFVLQR